jgi:hypothetical protein
MASLVLEKDQIPPFWRELGAAALSPSTGFNRLAFGNRFKGVFDMPPDVGDVGVAERLIEDEAICHRALRFGTSQHAVFGMWRYEVVAAQPGVGMNA